MQKCWFLLLHRVIRLEVVNIPIQSSEYKYFVCKRDNNFEPPSHVIMLYPVIYFLFGLEFKKYQHRNETVSHTPPRKNKLILFFRLVYKIFQWNYPLKIIAFLFRVIISVHVFIYFFFNINEGNLFMAILQQKNQTMTVS